MKVELKVKQTLVVDGAARVVEAGEKVEVDDVTGRDLCAAGAAKGLGGRPKKKPERETAGVTTESVKSSD